MYHCQIKQAFIVDKTTGFAKKQQDWKTLRMKRRLSGRQADYSLLLVVESKFVGWRFCLKLHKFSWRSC